MIGTSRGEPILRIEVDENNEPWYIIQRKEGIVKESFTQAQPKLIFHLRGQSFTITSE